MILIRYQNSCFLEVVETVKSFTLRGIDDKLYDEIKKHSADKSLSINKFIISLLKTSAGFEKEKKFTILHKG